MSDTSYGLKSRIWDSGNKLDKKMESAAKEIWFQCIAQILDKKCGLGCFVQFSQVCNKVRPEGSFM
jgi:hypothetical protein